MAKYTCKGMEFLVDKAGSATTYTKIPQMLSIGGPSKSRNTNDDTDLDSTAMEFSAGLVDNGELSLSLRWDPADTNHQFLQTWMDDGTTRSCRVTFPTTPKTLYTFLAFPTQFDPPGGNNSDPLTLNFSVKITGPVTVSTASP